MVVLLVNETVPKIEVQDPSVQVKGKGESDVPHCLIKDSTLKGIQRPFLI